MTDLSTQRRRCIAASESTYATDAVATALTTNTADIVYQDVRSIDITPTRVQVDLPRARGSHSGTRHKTVANATSVSADVAMTGWVSDTAGEEDPDHAVWLKGAGFNETIVSTTSSTYNLATVQQAAVSAYALHREVDGTGWRLDTTRGARGNAAFEFASNEEARYTWEGMGLYDDELSASAAFVGSDGAIALLKDGSTAVTARSTGEEKYADSDNILICRNITVTVNSNPWPVSNITFATGWTVSLKEVATGTAGVSKVFLTRADDGGSRPGGSFTLVDADTAMDDMLAKLKDAGEFAVTIVLTAGDGSAGSARCTITMPKCQIGLPTRQDSNGLLAHEVPYFANGDWTDLAGDNGVSFKFDEVP